MSIWDIILKVLTIAGSIGLFLYGMKLMSESLQKLAGRRIRRILSAISSDPARGIFSGLLITGTIQSSSATTVMVVSFVNAGLMSLVESFGMIMGANIGTTVTGWIISLLGFGKTFDIYMILLPLIALSLPFMFSVRSEFRSWSEFILGFVLLFMGLSFLRDAAPSPQEHPELITFIGNFTSYDYGSVLIFVLIGTIFTVIFQSSSAMMAFTFVIAIDGWISYELAAAMVLGENLGTTITANIAAIVGNVDAKRTAFFHFLFNLIGVIWALLLFKLFLNGIARIITPIFGTSPYIDSTAIPVSLALFHTSFNVLNTVFLIGFLKYMSKFVERIIRIGLTSNIEYRLKYIESFYVSTSELSIVQAKKEIIDYSKLVHRMFLMIPELLMEKRVKKYHVLYDKIKKYEDIVDNIEIEIATYLTKLSESKLSMKSSRQIQTMLRIISSLESIGDTSFSMANTISEKNEDKIYFFQDQRNHLNSLFTIADQALSGMIQNLESEYENASLKEAREITRKMNDMVNDLKTKHIDSLKKEHYSYKTGIYYIDIIELLEKVCDYTLNISEDITDINITPPPEE